MRARPAGRWIEAQSAERAFWESLTLDTVLGILRGYSAFLQRIGPEAVHELLDGRDVMDLGVGPLGISLASLTGAKRHVRRLVKVEPLRRLSLATTPAGREEWARPLVDWVEALGTEGEQVQVSGEAMGFREEFDTILVYNVLDHVDEPSVVLERCRAALRPSGAIVIAVDCRSSIGKARFNQVTRRTLKGTTVVDAHPHTFVVADVTRLLREAGFSQVQALGPPRGWRRIAGRATLVGFVARR